MSALTKDQIMDQLQTVQDPKQKNNIVALDMVSGVHINDDTILFTLSIDPNYGPEMESLRLNAEQSIQAIAPKNVKVQAMLTADKKPENTKKANASSVPSRDPSLLQGVKNIIAVASGKGGVGKSTVSTNLAISLSQQGLKVGLLDADIYGPSIPTMMGTHEKPQQNKEQKIVPLEKHGISFMSIGFMIDVESPLIWRGPMAQSALLQLMRDVDWGQLDVLIIDMPPGTGDVQLTTAQKIPVTGAVIVSTPQDVALIDAKKAINMFKKMDVPIMGIIENMSTFICPNCDHETHLFDHGGAEKTAEEFNVPFLGNIPLNIEIRQQGDNGVPIALSSDFFTPIAKQCTDFIS